MKPAPNIIPVVVPFVISIAMGALFIYGKIEEHKLATLPPIQQSQVDDFIVNHATATFYGYIFYTDHYGFEWRMDCSDVIGVRGSKWESVRHRYKYGVEVGRAPK